jgi:Family of unknown function (DUF6152)
MKLHQPIKSLLATTLLFAGTSSPLLAHHSAVQYDFTVQSSYQGVVTAFAAKNPHLLIKMTVTDANGTQEIEFEGHSLNNMYRQGFRKGMVNVGDKITVNVAPLKSGVDGGYVLSAVTAKEEFFGARSSRAAQATAEGKAPTATP